MRFFKNNNGRDTIATPQGIARMKIAMDHDRLFRLEYFLQGCFAGIEQIDPGISFLLQSSANLCIERVRSTLPAYEQLLLLGCRHICVKKTKIVNCLIQPLPNSRANAANTNAPLVRQTGWGICNIVTPILHLSNRQFGQMIVQLGQGLSTAPATFRSPGPL